MIPNLVKGRGISGAIRYSLGQGNDKATGERKTLERGEISRADILGGQNFGFDIDSADRLDMARRMMEWNGAPENQFSRGRKCETDCLHASLSWETGQQPTRDEMVEAAQEFLKALGMATAQAVFISHDDTEHRHLHIVASRIDPTTGKTFSQVDDFTKAQAWSLHFEREHGQISQNESRRNLHAIVDAIEARDGAAIVENLTQRNPTFTARDLDQALKYGELTKDARTAFRSEILAQKNVIGLRETAYADVTRYTTRAVLAAEIGLLRSAQKLADDRTHGLSESRIDAIAAAFTLKSEQADALRHLTHANGLGILWGEAGTGKSHTLNAVRTAYEAEGKTVIGLAWTNDVVQQMRGDGFKNGNTIASELKAIEEGRTAWGKNTVLIVDEAAMVATAHLASLADAANRAGAKVILAGDDAQLASIERGGMFETLRQRHGAAILEDVQRVKDLDQKAAFNTMHKGEFRGALDTFDKAGGIHWAETQTDALRDMAQRYAADSAVDPERRRFMFAFTNAEVGALNDHAREVHKQRGDLGDDVGLKTAHGEAVFAQGDRIQFSGNGYGRKAKNRGLTNGRVGTLTAIEFEGDFMIPRLTVALDTAKGKAPQKVNFVVGDDGKSGEFNNFKLGYAGTIYRGQGRTLDESYVCHSSQWRSSAAYVALTRHRESVEIFASRETLRGMDRRAEAFDEVAAAQATLDPAGLAAAQNAHALDVMAKGLARPETKRAATAYQLDDARVLRLVRHFDDLECRARAELLDLRQRLSSSPPAALVALRDDRSSAAARLMRLRSTRRAAEERLATLSAGRPSGLWSRVTGVTRMHDQRLEKAKKTCARRAGDVELASIRHRAAEARLLAPEARWAREARKEEAAREERRHDLHADLAWVADARACVMADPSLAHATQEEFAAAVGALRAERARCAERDDGPLVFHSPGYRPR